MKSRLTIAALMSLATASAFAAGSGDHSHDELKIGRAGKPAEATRTIDIVMMETDDGKMVFEPASFTVRQGETLKLSFVNEGEVDHEFVMDGHDAILEHKELMERFPEMEHDDPNAIRLQPGGKGEIVWTFATAGEFSFGCLIPGHYESGMKGDIDVVRN